jgi:hypothetical protein
MFKRKGNREGLLKGRVDWARLSMNEWPLVIV